MPVLSVNISSGSHVGRINSTSDARYGNARYDVDRYDLIQVLDSLTIVSRTDLWKPRIIDTEVKETDDGKPIVKQARRSI